MLLNTNLRVDASATVTLDPKDAWNAMRTHSGSLLTDVRTEAEFMFAGYPVVEAIGGRYLLAPVRSYPNMQPNPQFAETVAAYLKENGADIPALFFMCKLGGRSMEAAEYCRQTFGVPCVNIRHGMEGDKDADGRRGRVNGWKAENLPWEQR